MTTTPTPSTPPSLPPPAFEGSEKRLEIDFYAPAGGAPPGGLRAVPRAELDAMLDDAACCIVSHMGNAHLDAYVLSESSLFLTPRRFVLKTCGTTKLLAAVPAALAAAARVGLAPARVKYSRASFLFPDAQPEPHRDFGAETALLTAHFGHLGGGGGAYVLGDALAGLQWHVFVADAGGAAAVAEAAAVAARAAAVEAGADDDVAAAEADAAGAAAAAALPAGAPSAPPSLARPPTYTLEVCMTGLDPARAAQFARGPAFVDAGAVSAASGIGALLPGARLDDFVFDPCGYSANAVDGPAFATVHVTPEPHCSYASVELCGYAAEALCPSAVVARVASIFGAAKLSVAMSVDADVAFCPWLLSSLCFPPGYAFAGAAAQDFGGRGRTAFYSLAAEGAGVDRAAPAAAPQKSATPPSPPSPRGPLRLSPSLFSATSSLAAALAGSPGSDAGGTASPRSDGDRSLAPVRTPSPAPPALAALPPRRPPSPAAPLLPGGGAAAVLATLLDSRSPAACAAAAARRPSPRARPPAPAPLPAVLAAARAVRLPDSEPATLDAALAAAVGRHGLEDNTYLVDLASVARAHAAWAAALPRVDPFYAVKCNPDPAIVATLAACGAGFDCASAAEVDLVLALGVPPHRVIFANACKRPSDVRAAAGAGVDLTTFDTPGELAKLARHHPRTRALLRLRADDPAARCQLGNKYGCDPGAAASLLAAAKAAGVAVVGVSFHVGSGASDPAAFGAAIALARAAFDEGAALGFDMSVLDIGGGFAAPTRVPAADDAGAPPSLDLGPAPAAINAALDAHFPRGCGVRVIAEPGRYFAEGAATLACHVYGVRDGAAPCGAPTRDYWITDGLYGSMNCVLYDHATLAARPLGGLWAAAAGDGGGAVASIAEATADDGKPAPPLPPSSSDAPCCRLGCCGHVPPAWRRSTVFGPTCDGLDTVLRDYPLPRLAPGDWLAFPNMGAYTIAGASAFNGFAADAPTVVYAWSER